MNISTSLILSIDQGTTSTRAILFDPQGNTVKTFQVETHPIYPRNGWVEQDPEELLESVVSTVQKALAYAKDSMRPLIGVGITNQRETTLVWDRKTGKTIYNAIVWQDKRTASQCAALQRDGVSAQVNTRTGLFIDPYFSATKVAWILDNVDGARERAEAGELAFGTVDAFLLAQLAEGQPHLTDITNASRTNLFNIHTHRWDDTLLDIFKVPKSVLPEVCECTHNFGELRKDLFGCSLPILGVAGDQQAAAIGQACFLPGESKSTYGTGCFVLLNTGERVMSSKHNLLSTVAYTIKGKTHYALEGSIFSAGSTIQWLRDNLGIIQHVKETEDLAKAAECHEGIYLVPAFSGLGAPHWNANARAQISGLSAASDKKNIVRAALEAVVYQTVDLLSAIEKDGIHVNSLKVDGGMVSNNWLCQNLADLTNKKVLRPENLETTALGAAYLVGLQSGLYSDVQTLTDNQSIDREYAPSLAEKTRERKIQGWHEAVKQCCQNT